MSEIRMYEAQKFPSPCGVGVVSCMLHWAGRLASFRPLAGWGLFRPIAYTCGVYGWFPSPYGVWVVSAKLHILFGAAGKRIVNSAVLLYHIGRWFINSKLRNYKVPCEAHKTET